MSSKLAVVVNNELIVLVHDTFACLLQSGAIKRDIGTRFYSELAAAVDTLVVIQFCLQNVKGKTRCCK